VPLALLPTVVNGKENVYAGSTGGDYGPYPLAPLEYENTKDYILVTAAVDGRGVYRYEFDTLKKANEYTENELEPILHNHYPDSEINIDIEIVTFRKV